MKRVWDLCKVLANDRRRELLSLIYSSSSGGRGVGELVDKMHNKLEPPAVTQYLKQLEQIGLLRRERCGRYVGYYDDMREATDEIREIARMVRAQMKSHGGYDDHGMFRALMNAFRARVCNYLMEGGSGEKSAICAEFQHFTKYLVRDLQPAVEAGLLTEYVENYQFVTPADRIAKRVIELAA